ncbi:DUF4352 domain-containing protein [Nocardia sp. NPDC052566]|uniref:DUF4352 domain-containing protein n=1 Tax=Nocardia sp. NPDC052566 TaxID=3364330 RepID=UPI0037CAE131
MIASIVGFCGFVGMIVSVSGSDGKKADNVTSSAPAAPVVAKPTAPDKPTATAVPTLPAVPSPPTKPEADTPLPKTAAPPATPGLDTPVRDGKFEFVVTAIETGVSAVGDSPYLQDKAQGAYTIVSMTVKNISNNPKTFYSSDQYLYDTQGRRFENDSAAEFHVDRNTWLSSDINPGNSVTAKVVFDLPPDAIPSYLVLHDSMFSWGAKVTLR